MQKIVMVSQQRQGSTLAHSLLNSHSWVHGDGELFKEKTLQDTFPAWALKWVENYPHWYLRYKEMQCKKPVYLYKFMVNQVPGPRLFVKRMALRGYKIISIHRDDAIGIALSRCIAEQTKIWFVKSPEVRIKDKLQIDPQRVLSSLAEVDRYYRIQQRVLEGVDHLPIHYENDLCRNDNFNYFTERVCAYTGLPLETLQTNSLPTDDRKDAERIENFEEIVRAIQASEWAKYWPMYKGH